jgi:hypothetical protein
LENNTEVGERKQEACVAFAIARGIVECSMEAVWLVREGWPTMKQSKYRPANQERETSYRTVGIARDLVELDVEYTPVLVAQAGSLDLAVS